MNNKVKGKNLKLGDVLYVVNESHLSLGIKKVIVTGLTLNKKGDVDFHIDNEVNCYYYQYGSYITRSETKATKVYNILLEQQKQRNKRYIEEKEIRAENQIHLDVVSKNYVGKTVMVKFQRYGKETKYEKVTIYELYPTYKKGEYSFSTSPKTNQYLTSREGKNWYFWTELDELKKKKEDIEKRIKELEKWKSH